MRRPRSTTTLAATGAAALLLHLSAHHPHVVDAAPYLLLNSARPKCIEVKASAETLVYVDYQAPDLVILDDEEPDEPPKDEKKSPPDGPDGKEKSPEEARAEAQKGGEEGRGGNGDSQKFGSGHDKLWYEKNKAKLDNMRRLKGKAITDMVIMANEKGDTVGAARRRWRQQQAGGRRAPVPLTNIREELQTVNGTVQFETTQDGTVEICVQSLSASPSTPSLVTLSIREDMQQKREKETEKTDRRNLGVMESTLRGLVRRADLILKNADFAKDQEHDFHETTIAMNRATKYWPMLHCAILFITGVTMARHMTSFLKNHHIY